MSWLPPVLATMGVVGVLLALVSGPLQRWVPVSEPLVALAFGVLAGPAVLGLVTLEEDLADALAGTGAIVAGVLRSEVTAVVAVHAGPGVLGVVVAPAG